MGTNVNVGIQKIRVSREKDPQMLINWGKGTSNRPNATTELTTNTNKPRTSSPSCPLSQKAATRRSNYPSSPANDTSPNRQRNVKADLRE